MYPGCIHSKPVAQYRCRRASRGCILRPSSPGPEEAVCKKGYLQGLPERSASSDSSYSGGYNQQWRWRGFFLQDKSEIMVFSLWDQCELHRDVHR